MKELFVYYVTTYPESVLMIALVLIAMTFLFIVEMTEGM